MRTEEEVPIALVPVGKIRRSFGAVSDETPPPGEHMGLLAVCVVAAIGVFILVGLVFTSGGPFALSGRAPADASARAQIDPLHMMMISKDLPANYIDDYSFVFN